MIIDKFTQLSLSQAITASAASTNVYDTGQTGDIGIGGYIEIFVRIVQAFNNLTSLTISLQSSPDNSTWTTIWSVPVLLAALTANTPIAVPPITQGAQRYLQMLYTVVGTAPTTGTITAEMVLSKQQAPFPNAGI